MANESVSGSPLAATLTYYLSLAGTGLSVKEGSAWKDSGGSPVSFSRTVATSVKYAGVEMTLSLYGVSFTRQLCEPGHIEAEILIMTAGSLSVDRLEEMLVRRPVTLSVKYSETGETSTLARDYYIHEIASQVQIKDGVNYIYVKLDIFSPDKILTLNKFSDAYLGRSLFGDLTKEVLDDFVLRYPGKGAPKLERKIPVEVGVLHHLGYQLIGRSKVGKEIPSQKEMIHPYLVQYNESYYDFLSRVANRCGEVFYYENGRFNLGVHKQKDGPKYVSGAKRVIFQRVSPEPLTVPEYTRDSVKEWNIKTNSYSPDSGKVFSDPVARNGKGYPAEAFPPAVQGLYKKYYHSEIAAEDQYMLLYKDKFARDSFLDYWWGNTDKHLMSTLNDALNSTSLLEFVNSSAGKLAEGSRLSRAAVSQATAKGNSALKDAALEGEDKYAVLLAKISNSTGRWFTLNYFTDLKRKEQEQMRKMVCVDMADQFMDVKLGDRIMVPGQDGEYLVVKIEMTAPEKWQCNYDASLSSSAPLEVIQSQRFFAIPTVSKVTKTTWTKDFKPKMEEPEDGEPPVVILPESVLPEGLQEGTTVETENTDCGTRTTVTTVKGTVVTVVTTTISSVLYPPLRQVPLFRTSGAQSAFIVDSGDPVSQGRVRVRYPWQPSIKKLDDAVDKCQKDDNAQAKALKAAQSKLAAQKENGGFFIDDAQKECDDAAAEKKKTEKQLKSAKDTRMMYEAATPWIRMATPMATPGGGMYFKPEVGDEVIVDFENGNIERPFVVGTLYSKNLTVPPGSRTIVSRNGHTIRMDDPTDVSVLQDGLYPALRLLSSYGVKIPSLDGKAKSMLGGIEMTDKFGFYDIKMSSHDRNISISSPFGDIKIGALTGISIDAPNGDINISGKNVNISAWNNLNFNSGGNVKPALDADGRLGRYYSSMRSKSKYFDLSLLRSLLEALVRPVDGTLEIKSGRYLLLESGGGTAMAEWAKYDSKAKREALVLEGLIRYAVGKVPGLRACVTAYNDAVRALDAVKQYLPEGNPSASPAPVAKPASASELLKDMVALDYKNCGADDVCNACMGYYTKMEFDPSCSPWEAEQCYRRVQELGNALAFWKRFVTDQKTGLLHIYDEIRQKDLADLVPKDFLKDANALLLEGDDDSVKAFSDILKMVSDAMQNNKVDGKLFAETLEESAFHGWETGMKRRVAHLIIEQCRIKEHNPFQSIQIEPAVYAPVQQTMLTEDSSVGDTVTETSPSDPPFSDNDWKLYVSNLRLMDKPGAAQGTSDATQPLLPVESDGWRADSKSKGDILFANQGDKTYRFTEFGQTEVYRNPGTKEECHTAASESLRNLLTGI